MIWLYQNEITDMKMKTLPEKLSAQKLLHDLAGNAVKNTYTAYPSEGKKKEWMSRTEYRSMYENG